MDPAITFLLFSGFWEEVYWPPGYPVQVNLHAESCPVEWMEWIEGAVIRRVERAQIIDPKRRWTYEGHTPNPSVDGDGIVTIGCGDDSFIGNSACHDDNPRTQCPAGEGLPQLNDARTYIVDGYVRLNTGMFDHHIAWTVHHELGHVFYTLQHSNVPGSTMAQPGFSTTLSSQIMESFSHDDWCGVKTKYDLIGEPLAMWPYLPAVIDDMAHLRVPYGRWKGKDYEFTMLNNGQLQYSIVLAKELVDCEELDQR